MLADAIHELRKGSAERKTLEGLLLPQYPLPVPPEIDTWIIEIGGGYGRYEFVGTEEEADIERRRKATFDTLQRYQHGCAKFHPLSYHFPRIVDHEDESASSHLDASEPIEDEGLEAPILSDAELQECLAESKND